MRKVLLSGSLLFGAAGAWSGDFPKSADEITYQWLCSAGGGYTDHIPHFNHIFSAKKMHTFLEFGLGFATKFFLDHCDRVISVEFVTNGYGPDWLKECLMLYRRAPHWTPIAYFSDYSKDMSWAPLYFVGGKMVSDACGYQCATHQWYALIDDSYLKELDGFISNIIDETPVDIAFVDAGIYLRGDLVQLLFGKVPLILAHDCPRTPGDKDDVYGYCRVKPPADYEEITIRTGKNTTIWIRQNEELRELSTLLKRYAAIF